MPIIFAERADSAPYVVICCRVSARFSATTCAIRCWRRCCLNWGTCCTTRRRKSVLRSWICCSKSKTCVFSRYAVFLCYLHMFSRYYHKCIVIKNWRNASLFYSFIFTIVLQLTITCMRFFAVSHICLLFHYFRFIFSQNCVANKNQNASSFWSMQYFPFIAFFFTIIKIDCLYAWSRLVTGESSQCGLLTSNPLPLSTVSVLDGGAHRAPPISPRDRRGAGRSPRRPSCLRQLHAPWPWPWRPVDPLRRPHPGQSLGRSPLLPVRPPTHEPRADRSVGAPLMLRQRFADFLSLLSFCDLSGISLAFVFNFACVSYMRRPL